MTDNLVESKCLRCGASIVKYTSQVKKGHGKFCSDYCKKQSPPTPKGNIKGALNYKWTLTRKQRLQRERQNDSSGSAGRPGHQAAAGHEG